MQFYGVTSFSFPLTDISELTQRRHLAGNELIVSATVFDWSFLQEKTNVASAFIVESDFAVKILGGRVKIFTPGQVLRAEVECNKESGWARVGRGGA